MTVASTTVVVSSMPRAPQRSDEGQRPRRWQRAQPPRLVDGAVATTAAARVQDDVGVGARPRIRHRARSRNVAPAAPVGQFDAEHEPARPPGPVLEEDLVQLAAARTRTCSEREVETQPGRVDLQPQQRDGDVPGARDDHVERDPHRDLVVRGAHPPQEFLVRTVIGRRTSSSTCGGACPPRRSSASEICTVAPIRLLMGATVQISPGQAVREASASAASACSKHSCGGWTSPAPT